MWEIFLSSFLLSDAFDVCVPVGSMLYVVCVVDAMFLSVNECRCTIGEAKISMDQNCGCAVELPQPNRLKHQ